MTVRVEVVTPCEPHGRYDVHEAEWPNYCQGSRRTFTEWPPEAIEAAEEAFWYATGNDSDALKAYAAALWGHITGDNK